MSSALANDTRSTSEEIASIGLRAWLERTASNRLPVDADRALTEWHLEEQSKTPNDVAVSIMQIVETIDLAALPGKVSAPVLLVSGDRSPNAPVAEQAALKEAFPTARLLIMPNTGVGLQLEKADECAAAILAFIKEL